MDDDEFFAKLTVSAADPAGLIERVLILARRQPLTDAERNDCDMLEDFAVNYLGDD